MNKDMLIMDIILTAQLVVDQVMKLLDAEIKKIKTIIMITSL